MHIYTLSKIVIALALLTAISNAELKPQENRGAIISKDGTVIAISNDPNTKRQYPLGKSLTPLLGYVRYEQGGKKGLERYAERHLNKGYTMHLTIDASLQKSVETILDRAKEELKAKEVIAAVMQSSTGKVLTMASSNRFNPMHITYDDVSALNPKFGEYPYEPGSIIKPLILAIALDHHLLTPDTFFKTYDGRMEIGDNRTITDDEKFEALIATDIIVHSSNIGISQIGWLLTGKEFRDGLLNFGLGVPSGSDLSRDLPGRIKPLEKLNNKLHRANTSYGYGIHATLVQLLKAYSAFNNNGITVVPQIINHFTDSGGNRYFSPRNTKTKRVISSETAEQIHDILLEVIKRGTGVYAAIPGLKIGGKTGTARITNSEGYHWGYHSSFYGFANDDAGGKYTIGVLVINAKKKNAYFASQSAVPVFREMVEAMVESGYLVP